MATSPELAQRVSDLEQRVRLLERRLAMRDLLHPEPTPEPKLPSELVPLAPSEPPELLADSVELPPSVPARVETVQEVTVEEVPVEAEPVVPESAATPPARADERGIDLEWLVGGRFFAAIGAIVVVIGIGLFVRLAYQNGWLNLIPPAGKCWAGAVFSAALIVAGETLRRRFGALASAGFSAAGLGGLYAAVYAAYGLYSLVPAPAAFALLAGCATVGFVIAARGRLVSIGVLSLLAAYVNPLIIGQAVARPLVLPAYLFALLGAALALSGWRAIPFRPLRSLAWWGTLVYGGVWTTSEGLQHPAAALTFLLGVWAAVHTELAVASRRSSVNEPVTGLGFELLWSRARFIATSLSSTAWAAALAVHTLREGGSVSDWWPPAAIALAAAGLAIRLAGNLRILRDVPRTDLERLGAGLAVQAGALLMTAVALALSGWLEVAAWLTLGLAAIGTGRWIRSRGLEVYGLVALAIAALRLIVHDSPVTTPSPWEIDLGGIILTRWALLMAVAATVWAAASVLVREGAGPWRTVRVSALIAGLIFLNLALVHPRADGMAVCAAWLVIGLAGILLGRAKAQRPLVIYGIIVLIASTARFLFGSPVTGGSSPILLTAAGLVVTRWSVLMVFGAGAWIAAAALIRESPRRSSDASQLDLSLRSALVGIGIAMLFAAVLHPEARAVSVAHAWLALAVAVFGAHAIFRRLLLEYFGVAGLAVAAAAWGVAYVPGWMDSVSLAPRQGLVSSVLFAAVAIGSGLWVRRFPHPERPASGLLWRALVPGASLLLLASTSLEVARVAGVLSSEPAARRAAVSIWWGCVGVGLIGTGFWRRVAVVRHLGLAMILIATAKAAVYDLASVPQIWRIASFIGLGLLMLGVAVAYARVSAKSDAPEASV